MHQCFVVSCCSLYYHCALLEGRVTWRLVSDVRRGSRRSSPARHDIAGPGLHLDLPKAHVSSTAGFSSGDVAPNCRPIEKQAATGQLARGGAVGAHEPGHGHSESRLGRRAGWFVTGFGCHDCHRHKQESPEGGRHVHCMPRKTYKSARATSQVLYAGMYLCTTRSTRDSPGCPKNKLLPTRVLHHGNHKERKWQS